MGGGALKACQLCIIGNGRVSVGRERRREGGTTFQRRRLEATTDDCLVSSVRAMNCENLNQKIKKLLF